VDKAKRLEVSSDASLFELPVSISLLLSLTLSAATPAGMLRCDAPETASAATAAAPATDSALVALYEGGETWEQFLARARARRAVWLRNAELGGLPADALATARALPGRWRLLVIAVDACSDSVNTIPFVAQLVAVAPQLEMRIISPDAGREVMARRRTPDGRPATPTVVLLDESGTEAGCWIERPAALQAIAMDARAGGGTSEFAANKQAWYDADAGVSTVREIVALLEKAAAGARGCDAPRGPAGQ
jgi:hypothetical protein